MVNKTISILIGTFLCACGQTQLEPISAPELSLHTNSTLNGIVVRAADATQGLSGDESAMFAGEPFEDGTVASDDLLVIVSNRALSCAAPLANIGCNHQAGWQLVMALNSGVRLETPVPLENAPHLSREVDFTGANGCSAGARRGSGIPDEELAVRWDTDDLFVQLSGTERLDGGFSEGDGAVISTSINFDGEYPLVRCGAFPEFDPPGNN